MTTRPNTQTAHVNTTQPRPIKCTHYIVLSQAYLGHPYIDYIYTYIIQDNLSYTTI